MTIDAQIIPSDAAPTAIDGEPEMRHGASTTLDAVAAYRRWVSEHRVAAAMLAGLIATHVATVAGYWMYGIGLPQLDWNRLNGQIYTPNASSDLQFLSGGIFHYADGIVFSILFALTIHPFLRWGSTPLANVLKGLFFGTVLATISCAFMTPRVYMANVDVGFFSHNLGWATILAVYVWHWIFGLQLGVVYNPSGKQERIAAGR